MGYKPRRWRCNWQVVAEEHACLFSTAVSGLGTRLLLLHSHVVKCFASPWCQHCMVAVSKNSDLIGQTSPFQHGDNLRIVTWPDHPSLCKGVWLAGLGNQHKVPQSNMWGSWGLGTIGAGPRSCHKKKHAITTLAGRVVLYNNYVADSQLLSCWKLLTVEHNRSISRLLTKNNAIVEAAKTWRWSS